MRTPFLLGLREAAGAPALVLFASFVGFGSLVRGNGWDLVHGLASSMFMWALPGQVAMIESWGVGAGLVAVVTAVALTNLRLLPMVMALMPQLRRPGVPRWQVYLAAHLIAVTTWVIGMRRCPGLPEQDRLPYFFGMAAGVWCAGMIGTVVGYLLARNVSPSVSLGLVFVNPMYFVLVLMPDSLRNRPQILSLVFGAVLGPAFHLLSRDWGLLGTGLVAGTLAFVLGGRARRG
jgi:predicted branched-subunit amino acid permease